MKFESACQKLLSSRLYATNKRLKDLLHRKFPFVFCLLSFLLLFPFLLGLFCLTLQSTTFFQFLDSVTKEFLSVVQQPVGTLRPARFVGRQLRIFVSREAVGLEMRLETLLVVGGDTPHQGLVGPKAG